MLDFFTVVEDIGHGEGLANTIRDRFVRLLLWRTFFAVVRGAYSL